MNRKTAAVNMCLAAFAACINIAGGQIALIFRLPVYLDSIGTILTGVLLGPFYGMVPNLLSGIIMGMTSDIYSLYFAPVGMITGFMAGIVSRCFREKVLCGYAVLPAAAACITVPGTVVSSLICAKLFGGITSSGSTVLIQLLSHTALGMTASVFAVQVLTDYLDRLLSLYLVGVLVRVLPADLKRSCFRGKRV